MDPISSSAASTQRIGPGGMGPTKRAGDKSTGEASSASFGDAIKDALGEAQDLQTKADDAITKLAKGETQDIHQVLAAYEQARLSMQMLVETRNKLVEAYQDISRMPI